MAESHLENLEPKQLQGGGELLNLQDALWENRHTFIVLNHVDDLVVC